MTVGLSFPAASWTGVWPSSVAGAHMSAPAANRVWTDNGILAVPRRVMQGSVAVFSGSSHIGSGNKAGCNVIGGCGPGKTLLCSSRRT